jgi:cell division protein ZapA
MGGRAVELCVAGISCRVATSADDAELTALTALVEEKLASVLKPGRPVTKQAMLLAAIALAHDVREQRARADAILSRSKETLGRLLERVDEVLAQSDDLALERHGDAAREGDGAYDDGDAAPSEVGIAPPTPKPRGQPLPGATIERLRDVYRVDSVRARSVDKEQSRE